MKVNHIDLKTEKIYEIIKNHSLERFDPKYFSIDELIDVNDFSELLNNLCKIVDTAFKLIDVNKNIFLSIGKKELLNQIDQKNTFIDYETNLNNILQSNIEGLVKNENDYYAISLKINILDFHIATLYSCPLMLSEEKAIDILSLTKSFVRNLVTKSEQSISHIFEIVKQERLNILINNSLERYKNLINSFQYAFALHKMIYDKDKNPIDYEFLDVNLSFERLLGKSKKDIIGKTVLELLPETEMYWIRNYDLVIKARKPLFFENYSKELKKTFYVSAFSPNEGEFAVLIQDISENIKLKDIISEAEQQFNLLTNQMPGILWEVDSELRFISILGGRFSKIFIKPERFIGKTIYQLFRTNDKDYEPIKKHLLTLKGKPQKYEFNFGNIIMESLINPLYDRNKKIKGVIGIAFDITEKKKNEEKYIKENNLRSLGLLAGGIAHDFNNIVAGILGNASLAKFSFDDSELTGLMDQIEEGCLKAKNLTNQLLTFSKGGMPILERININELIMNSAAFALSGSNIEICYNFEDEYKFLTVDQSQINLVIHNIIINSIQAMPKGGKIDVTTELYEQHIDNEDFLQGYYLLIKVVDYGIGIKPEDIKYVFDPYFTTKFIGNGLGLSVCYSIIKKHKGHISIYSQLSKGTQVNIYLPIEKYVSKKIKEQEKIKVEYSKKADILIVDDEVMIRNVLEQIFKKLGHNIIFCDRGEAALKIYQDLHKKKSTPDFVILDLTIPGGINGIECFKKLKQINNSIKAILMSGYIDTNEKDRYLELGFFAVLNKPFGFNQVVNILNEVLK